MHFAFYRIVLPLLLLLAFPSGAAAQGVPQLENAERPPVEAFRPLSEVEATVAVLAEGSALAAAGLEARSECHLTRPGVAVSTLTWSHPNGNAGAQRIDITEFREGFATGRLQASGELGPARRSAAIENPLPGVMYYWRVVRRTPEGWVPSRVGRFFAFTCPDDRRQEEAPARSTE